MHAALADSVYAVINRGLAVRDRLEAGEPVDWKREKKGLHEFLSAFTHETEAAPGSDDFAFVLSEQGSKEERGRLSRATIGFALTCWLDEWLTLQVPPRSRWPDVYAFGSEGGRFWDEARYAETRDDFDALEAMYLCVMLGFRGGWRDQPAQVEAWATRIRARLEQAERAWTTPASLETPRWDRRFADEGSVRRLAFSLLLTLSLLAPLALVLLWKT